MVLVGLKMHLLRDGTLIIYLFYRLNLGYLLGVSAGIVKKTVCIKKIYSVLWIYFSGI